MDETSSSQRGAFIARLGAWLQVAPLLGIVATLFGMTGVLSVLKTSGAGDPARLDAAIGDVVIYITIAVSIALLGLVLVTVAITVCGYRAKWMFRFLRFYGVLSIALSLVLMLVYGPFNISLSLLFGVFFLIFAQVKKEEFQRVLPVKRKLPSCYKLDD